MARAVWDFQDLICIVKVPSFYSIRQQIVQVLIGVSVPKSSRNQKNAYAIMESWLHMLEAKDPLFLTQFVKAFQYMVKRDFIQKVPKKDLRKTQNYHVIATLPVKQPHKVDHPCRICFQAKQVCENGKSLNSCLFTGQDILQNLIKTTIRFRSHRYCCTLDIA